MRNDDLQLNEEYTAGPSDDELKDIEQDLHDYDDYDD